MGHNGRVPTPAPEPAGRTEAPNQRERILRTALSLMSQQGVDGTSMRSLAAATGLTVATLYHYFPSKRDLLVAVLEERGFLDTPGEIISDSTGITVKINRRAYSPVLREADLPADTAVPWWDGRLLRFEFA